MDSKILSIAGCVVAAFMVHTELKMDKLDIRMTQLESRVDKIERQFDRIERQMNRIEEKLDDVVHTKSSITYSDKELDCLTKNIYYEAGIEDRTGKYAVATVTVNRMITGRWGGDLCKVVYAPKQFSWTSNKRLPKPYTDLWAESHQIARDVLNGARIRGLADSLFYHATYIKQPKWADDNEYVVTIGRHIFYNRAKRA